MSIYRCSFIINAHRVDPFCCSHTQSDIPGTTDYSEADTSRLLIGQEVQE